MRNVALLLLLLSSQSLLAAEKFCDTGKPHPIDEWYENSLKKTDYVTSRIREVQGETFGRWDKELNRVYTELLNSLNDQDKNRLREAQRAWLKFRDAEFNLLWAEGLYGGVGGTLAPVAVSEASQNVLRQRVCTLFKYQQLQKHNQ